ncbi:MAG: hypothetical protein M1825_001409 [Sarcosagium campestre]|nr:MAG: hypothetical protein M1825_001409 [Sarcosagium campestre]
MDAKAADIFQNAAQHRLPTVSASQALRSDASLLPRAVPTRLSELDWLLSGRGATKGAARQSDNMPEGLPRGQVTEVYGPPGAGKTSLAMQAAASALVMGGAVVWIGSLRAPYFVYLTVHEPESISDTHAHGKKQQLQRFHHFSIPSLAHLLALLLHPSKNFPPAGTSLLVIDCMSNLFNTAFPRNTEEPTKTARYGASPAARHSDMSQQAAGRRWAVMSDLITGIHKLATMRGLAVLIINETVMSTRSEGGAVLAPAMTSTAWQGGIANRVVIYRDNPPLPGDIAGDETEDILRRTRFAGVQKSAGATHGNGVLGHVIPFIIKADALEELRWASVAGHPKTTPVASTDRKRKRHDSTLHPYDLGTVTDSEDEYGWATEGLDREIDIIEK